MEGIITFNFALSVFIRIAGTCVLLIALYYLIHIGNKHVDNGYKLNPTKKQIIKWSVGIISLLALFYVISKFQMIRMIIMAALIAGLIAYVINPLVNRVEKRLKKRALSITIIFILLGLIVVLLFVAVIPKIGSEIINFIKQLPSNFQTAFASVEEWINTQDKLDVSFIDPKEVNDQLWKILDNIKNAVLNSTKSISSGINSLLNISLTIFLVPLFAFQFLMKREKMIAWILSLIPEEYKDDIIELGSRCDKILRDFFRARGLMSVFVGVVTMIALIVLGVDFAPVIGFITMVGDIVPYVGPLFGYIPAVIFALLISPVKALWVTVIFLAIQWVENNIIAPILIGDSMGLNSLVILLAILIGGAVFGVLGMIVSIPLVGVALEIYKFYSEKEITLK